MQFIGQVENYFLKKRNELSKKGLTLQSYGLKKREVWTA